MIGSTREARRALAWTEVALTLPTFLPCRVVACLALALMMVAGVPANGQTQMSRGDSVGYERGMIPIAVGIAPDFNFDGADGVIIRLPGATAPNDIILLREETSSGSLLASALGILSLIQGRFGACPVRRQVLRVSDNGVRPPEWFPVYDDTMNAHLARVRAADVTDLRGFGAARWRPLWIMRAWSINEVPRPIYGVCEGGPTKARQTGRRDR